MIHVGFFFEIAHLWTEQLLAKPVSSSRLMYITFLVPDVLVMPPITINIATASATATAIEDKRDKGKIRQIPKHCSYVM